MSIGGSAALIIIGAILRFAISWTPAYVNIQMIGLILMIGGIVGLAVSLTFYGLRRRREMSAEVTEERHYIEPRP